MMTPSSFLVPGLLLVILIVVAFMVLYPRMNPPPNTNVTVETDGSTLAFNNRLVTISPSVVSYPSSWWRSNLNGWNNWFGYLTPSTTRWPSFWRPVAYNNW